MRYKPKPKTCYSKQTVVYEIPTMKRTEYRSVSRTSSAIGYSKSRIHKVLKAGMLIGEYVVAYVDDDADAKIKAQFLHDKGCYKIRKRNSKNEVYKVPLRIDSRTVIYVVPENCNDEYAELYRNKIIESQKMNSIR